MKRLFPLLLSIFFIQCSAGKISELYQKYNNENYIYWDETRGLTWDDFQGEPPGSSENYTSEIHIYNPSSIEKANLFSPAKLTAICVFDKRHSWVNKNTANDLALRYNQTIFNIYEVYTRKLRKIFTETEFGLNNYSEKFHTITDSLNNELMNRIDEFRKVAKWAGY